MTDAKELAARLRARSEYYDTWAHDIRAMNTAIGTHDDADYSEATAIELGEAAAALEAQADLINKLRRVVETNVMGKPLEGEGLAWAEATVLQQQAEEIRALSRAAAGGE